MAHSDNPIFDEEAYETINADAVALFQEGENVEYIYESDSTPVVVDDAQHVITDKDGNKWRVRVGVARLEPVVVK